PRDVNPGRVGTGSAGDGRVVPLLREFERVARPARECAACELGVGPQGPVATERSEQRRPAVDGPYGPVGEASSRSDTVDHSTAVQSVGGATHHAGPIGATGVTAVETATGGWVGSVGGGDVVDGGEPAGCEVVPTGSGPTGSDSVSPNRSNATPEYADPSVVPPPPSKW